MPPQARLLQDNRTPTVEVDGDCRGTSEEGLQLLMRALPPSQYLIRIGESVDEGRGVVDEHFGVGPVGVVVHLQPVACSRM